MTSVFKIEEKAYKTLTQGTKVIGDWSKHDTKLLATLCVLVYVGECVMHAFLYVFLYNNLKQRKILI